MAICASAACAATAPPWSQCRRSTRRTEGERSTSPPAADRRGRPLAARPARCRACAPGPGPTPGHRANRPRRRSTGSGCRARPTGCSRHRCRPKPGDAAPPGCTAAWRAAPRRAPPAFRKGPQVAVRKGQDHQIAGRLPGIIGGVGLLQPDLFAEDHMHQAGPVMLARPPARRGSRRGSRRRAPRSPQGATGAASRPRGGRTDGAPARPRPAPEGAWACPRRRHDP